MAWRIIKQPNGKLARFSEVVDDFTHSDMTEEEAIKVCMDEFDMGKNASVEKVKRGEKADYFDDAIEIIKSVHGEGLALKRVCDLSVADT